ncbi:ATP-dependent 6-phosphofructokinase 4, chloroplastic [Vitis vinifera]|uniref:ATP-dependent 6-phosphofructokinase 4, chloroplastic n=1 Tax=Vitis vinifera TaxID=29760 RepID=A0A438CWS5_VITVI|nr:ATP-dependent 6-phosphofructokinase 4, chloroplastic [Vitis vinifera]
MVASGGPLENLSTSLDLESPEMLSCPTHCYLSEAQGLLFSISGHKLQVIDKSFGFDTAVEEAQRAINAAHVEVESVENGVGIVKLMGRYSGFIAMFATLASRDVVNTSLEMA